MRAAASKSASKAKPAAKGKAKAPPPPDEDEDDAMDEDVVERTDPVAADAEDEDDDMELVPTKKAVNKAHAMKQSKTKAAAEDTDIALAPVAAEADESLRGAEEDDESLRGAEEDQESAPVMFAPAAASGVDELAEINGVKPNVSMADGDEREVGSMTRCDNSSCARRRMLSLRAVTLSTRSSGRGTTTTGTSIPPHTCVLLYYSRQHMPGTP
jgi:hypothetical protein